jgi:hypothetical protein
VPNAGGVVVSGLAGVQDLGERGEGGVGDGDGDGACALSLLHRMLRSVTANRRALRAGGRRG